MERGEQPMLPGLEEKKSGLYKHLNIPHKQFNPEPEIPNEEDEDTKEIVLPKIEEDTTNNRASYVSSSYLDDVEDSHERAQEIVRTALSKK